MRRLALVLILLVLTACAPAPLPAPPDPANLKSAAPLPPRQSVRNFITVLERLGPVVTSVCETRAPDLNCDFIVVLDDRPGVPANAFQTVDDEGRPVIAFTLPLLAQARNQDELAFILSHEAAHHIEGHLPRQNDAALIGATILGSLASLSGDDETVDNAIRVGAAIGARTFSKEFELEADALGAYMTEAAGYDARLGAEFFFRIPDPGNKFLGTHPPNADRVRIVNDTVTAIRQGNQS